MIWMVSVRVLPLTVQEASTMKLERLFLMVTTPFSLTVAMAAYRSGMVQVTAGLETTSMPLNASTPSAMVALTLTFFLKTSSFSSPPSVIFRVGSAKTVTSMVPRVTPPYWTVRVYSPAVPLLTVPDRV